MIVNLQNAGVRISVSKYAGGKNWKVKVTGTGKTRKARFLSFNDHRTAMSLIVFGIASGKEHSIDDVKCIDKSFPEFISTVNTLY